MDLQVGVKAVLINKDGAVLVLKRAQEMYGKTDGVWDIPGGRIHTGVPLLENLMRELEEETGLSLMSVPRLRAAQDILLQQIHVVRLTYVAHVEGTVRLSNEHTEYRWVRASELLSLLELDRYVRELIERKELVLE